MEARLFGDLLKIMDTLLGEGGCPWDREQTSKSLKPQLLEECYELIDAMDTGDAAGMREELGDILWDVIFHCRIAEKEGKFTASDVLECIREKMVRRHPHIFADVIAGDTETVLSNWDHIKKKEKGASSFAEELQAVPKALPALARAEKVVKRAEKSGVTPESFVTGDIIAELRDCLDAMSEVTENSDNDYVFGLIGKFLLETVKFSRKNQINPEFALTSSTETFINMFKSRENGFLH